MKKIICTLCIVLGMLGPVVVLPASASAVNVFQACSSQNGVSAGSSDVCKQASSNGGKNPVIQVLIVVLDIISIVVGIAAVAMVVIGGFKFVTSGGDPSSVKSARDTIIYALIGAIVVAASQTFVAFVLNRLK